MMMRTLIAGALVVAGLWAAPVAYALPQACCAVNGCEKTSGLPRCSYTVGGGLTPLEKGGQNVIKDAPGILQNGGAFDNPPPPAAPPCPACGDAPAAPPPAPAPAAPPPPDAGQPAQPSTPNPMCADGPAVFSRYAEEC
jgi:hypothetical protein